MERDKYIDAVKAKLEEISPFDEPDNFIAEDDSEGGTIKPIKSYIESELDNAAKFCLFALPTTLLADDIETENVTIKVDDDGVGSISDMYDCYRLLRLSCDDLKRDIISFLTTEHPLYVLQQNKYTRGGAAKPMAAYCADKSEIQVFSFKTKTNRSGKLVYIDTNTKAERVQSHIENFIVIRCAMIVSRILGNNTASQLLEKAWNEETAPLPK